MVWFTVKRSLALFPARTIVRDPHHRESPTRCEANKEAFLGISCRERYTTVMAVFKCYNVRNTDIIRLKLISNFSFEEKRCENNECRSQ